jgi:thiol-disulfide isomerase/thioredoxin
MRSLFFLTVIAVPFCMVVGCDDAGKSKTKAHDDWIRPPEVGRAAPDVEGVDLDDNFFRLSDYKKKVVFLDFWAMWCGPCEKFLPHGKQLVEKFAGRPFVALGVNNDRDPRTPKESKFLAMRCWADGYGGPITRRWGIESFPTMYLIDHEGIIRKKYEGAPGRELDDAIERLLRIAEGKSKS